MQLSTLDRTVLNTSKVQLFVKSVDVLDGEKVGILLETDEGLTTDWATVKRVYSRFDKRREWNDVGSSMTGPCTGGTDSGVDGRDTKVARVGHSSNRSGQGSIRGRNSGGADEDGARSLDRASPKGRWW